MANQCQKSKHCVTTPVTITLTAFDPLGWCSTVGCVFMMDVQIVTETPDGGWKQLLQAKRVSKAAISFVIGTNNGQLGIDTLEDFLAWFSKDRYEQEIKYVIDATADTLEGLKSVAERGSATPRLRQTWESARSLLDATTARSSTTAGLTNKQLEAPLGSEKDALDTAWQRRDNLSPPAWLQRL